MDSTVQWVECTRCAKWRILLEGRQDEIPDVWFCEMNSGDFNNCEAPEQEYIEPVPVVRRLPKSNDPEAVRARLKTMSLLELQAAFDSFDLDEVLRLEFKSSDLVAAKSLHLIVNNQDRLNGEAKMSEKSSATLKHLVKEASELLPRHVTEQFTHKV